MVEDEDQLTGVTTEAFVQGYSLAQRLAVVGLGGPVYFLEFLNITTLKKHSCEWG